MTRCTCRPRDTCENCFAAQVKKYAELNGWLVQQMPPFRPTCSSPGFPDMVLVRQGRLILAELKRMNGVVSGPQQEWRRELRRTPCEYYLWFPCDWPSIEDRLRRPPTPGRRPSRLRGLPYDQLPEVTR